MLFSQQKEVHDACVDIPDDGLQLDESYTLPPLMLPEAPAVVSQHQDTQLSAVPAIDLQFQEPPEVPDEPAKMLDSIQQMHVTLTDTNIADIKPQKPQKPLKKPAFLGLKELEVKITSEQLD